MKKITALLLVTLLCLSIAACNGGTDTSGSPGGSSGPSSGPSVPSNPEVQTLNPDVDLTASRVVDVVRHSSRNQSWDVAPWKNNGNGGNSIWYNIYSCLVANEAYGTPIEDMHLDMAESITFSADKMSATIKLRDYIHDSKGNPIKASDVVWSYQTAPEVAPTYARINNYMASIKIIDELTIEIEVTNNAPGTWEVLLCYTPIINQKWYEGASEDEKANDPATTGAYRVIDNVPNISTTLEAIEDFWQKDELRSLYQIVNAKQIIYVGILESAMRSIALENGELDSAFIDSAGVDRFFDDPNFTVNVFWMANPNTLVLNGSENSPFYNNPALRKAVLHAIDWEDAAIPVSGENLKRGHDTAPMLCSDYDPAWDNEEYYEYNPELAKQYLIEAGYTEGNGPTLHYICRSNPEQVSAATLIQSYLKAVGITMTYDGLDQGIYDAYQNDPTQWDMNWFTQSMAGGFVIESWIYYFGNRGTGGNASFIDDPTMQSLLNDALVKNDAASKNAFRSYVVDQAYAVNISNEPVYYVSRKGIDVFPVSFLINPVMNACVFGDDF